jgi:hypothetical protein
MEHNEAGLTAQDGSAPKFCPETRVAADAARTRSVVFMIFLFESRDVCLWVLVDELTV